MVYVSEINGIPLHYARTPNHPYGTEGYNASYPVQETFLRKLKICFQELFQHHPLGVPRIITCAGIFVNKPNSQHNRGRAFDLDAIFWDDYRFITKNFLFDYELYLGTESFLRKHFGIILNYFYNAAHRDHWHFDSSSPVDFYLGSKSRVLYLQLTLSYIYNEEVIIDGIWGPQTNGALNRVFHRLNIVGEITDANIWLQYLDLTGKIAFKLFNVEKHPPRLLENVYALLSEQTTAHSNAIMQALNSFRFNTATSNWLNSFEEEQDRLDQAIEELV